MATRKEEYENEWTTSSSDSENSENDVGGEVSVYPC